MRQTARAQVGSRDWHAPLMSLFACHAWYPEYCPPPTTSTELAAGSPPASSCGCVIAAGRISVSTCSWFRYPSSTTTSATPLFSASATFAASEALA